MEARNIKTSLRVAKLSSHSFVFKNAIYLSTKNQYNLIESYAAFKMPDSDLLIYYPIIFDQNVSATDAQMSEVLRHALHLRLDQQAQFELIDKKQFITSNAKKIAVSLRSIKSMHANNKSLEMNQTQLKLSQIKSLCFDSLKDYPICVGQDLALSYQNKVIVMSIDEITGSELAATHIIGDDTNLDISASPLSGVQFEMDLIANDAVIQQGLFAPKPMGLTFNLKGVGGQKKILEEVIRKLFYSRILPPELAAAYDVKHTKGVLFYGPPGTGKTHIARAVASMFPLSHVKVVNGPEFKSKYVGESSENVRLIFHDADEERAAKGKASSLHIFIFDELDAIAPIRGGSNGTHAEDDIVAQLLTKLDGVEDADNILIMGTTNRIDRVDPALLRPGRIEDHIEVGLLDEEGRFEILSVKTASMQSQHLLDNVDLKYWASEAKNFTAAELEKLVKNATHFAMQDNISTNNGDLMLKENIKTVQQLAHVNTAHFFNSFKNITPAFGVDQTCETFAKNVALYNQEISNIVNNFLVLLSKIEKSNQMNGFRLLISGESGVGKTSLAMYLAKMSHVNCIRTITPDKLLSLSLQKQLDYFDEELANASRVTISIIVLDDLESLVLADATRSNYHNLLRLKLENFLKSIAMLKSKCIVIATTNSIEFIKELHLYDLFNEHNVINNVNLSILSSQDTYQLLSQLCEKLEYKVLPSKYDDKSDNREICLPIRDLIYQLSKFCSDEANSGVLDIDDFYNISFKRQYKNY